MPLIDLGNFREPSPDELETMPVLGLEPEVEETEDGPRVDPKTGNLIYEQEDGSVIIDTSPEGADAKDKSAAEFGANLAEYLGDAELDEISFDILEGIEQDIASRTQWEDTYNRGIDMLGLTLDPASGSAKPGGGISNIKSSLLLEAIVRYQANFTAEMMPAGGPAKVEDTAPVSNQPKIPFPNAPVQRSRDEKAEAFEKDFNYYLTEVATEYYPDTDKMAFEQAFCGNGFKKQYQCPLRRRPVTISIPARDLIVSNDAVDLSSALRVTHRTKMAKSVVKRLQLNGTYRKVDLSEPINDISQNDEKIGQTEGISKSTTRQQDFEHTIYETIVELDIPGFEHEQDGEVTGLPLPYLVTLDKDSRQILAIYRHWKEGDPDYKKIMRIVHYPLIPGLGFYAIGFLNLIGNTARAVTGATQELLDAGMFASFPGGLISKGGGKQRDTNIRMGPGEFKEIDTQDKPIQQVVMGLPYKDPSPVLMQLTQYLEQNGMRLAGAGQIPVGEGRADVPVGTMLAYIEQMMKPISAIHKRNHRAQREELSNLRDLFIEDPTALSRYNITPARAWEQAEELADMRLVPASDPNVPSHTHRLMLATALLQLLGSPAAQKLLNAREILERVLNVMGVDQIDALFNPPQAPSPSLSDMAKAKELSQKDRELALKESETQREAANAVLNGHLRMNELDAQIKDRDAQRASNERIENMKLTEQRLRSGLGV